MNWEHKIVKADNNHVVWDTKPGATEDDAGPWKHQRFEGVWGRDEEERAGTEESSWTEVRRTKQQRKIRRQFELEVAINPFVYFSP